MYVAATPPTKTGGGMTHARMHTCTHTHTHTHTRTVFSPLRWKDGILIYCVCSAHGRGEGGRLMIWAKIFHRQALMENKPPVSGSHNMSWTRVGYSRDIPLG